MAASDFIIPLQFVYLDYISVKQEVLFLLGDIAICAILGAAIICVCAP